jgi:hypothetical protein
MMPKPLFLQRINGGRTDMRVRAILVVSERTATMA